MTAILRKYGEAATINFTLFEVDGIDFRVDAVHAAGDSAIMRDEGAEANTTNSFTDEGNGYSIVLTATEMQAARIVIYLVDQTATKVWLDTQVIIETYGNASAQHAFDLDTASVPQTADHTAGIADIPTVAEFNARTLVAASYFDPVADAVANVTLVATTTANTDMRGTDSAALASVCTEGRLAELDAANLPTDVAAIDTAAMRGTDGANTVVPDNTSITAILVDTGTTIPAQISALNDIAASDILTTALTESYAADGVAPTLSQAIYLIQQTIGDFSISGTTISVRELDGATIAATYTIDDATAPTSRGRTT